MAFRRDYEELTVITKTYDLILWSCHHTGKFPRTPLGVVVLDVQFRFGPRASGLVSLPHGSSIPSVCSFFR
jgi:hypothetical protein